MRNLIHLLRAWNAHPHAQTAWAAAVNLFVIFLGFYLMVWAPVTGLLIALRLSRHTGAGAQEVVMLGGGAKAALACVLIATLLLSGALAGFMRALFRGGMLDRTWVMVAFMPAVLALLVWLGSVIRQATQLASATSGDNVLVVAYLAAWLLPIGYAAKVPWDEFRDRCAGVVERLWTLRT